MYKMDKRPSVIAEWLISQFIRRHDQETILGDFEEVFITLYEEKGSVYAHTWYWL